MTAISTQNRYTLDVLRPSEDGETVPVVVDDELLGKQLVLRFTPDSARRLAAELNMRSSLAEAIRDVSPLPRTGPVMHGPVGYVGCV